MASNMVTVWVRVLRVRSAVFLCVLVDAHVALHAHRPDQNASASVQSKLAAGMRQRFSQNFRTWSGLATLPPANPGTYSRSRKACPNACAQQHQDYKHRLLDARKSPSKLSSAFHHFFHTMTMFSSDGGLQRTSPVPGRGCHLAAGASCSWACGWSALAPSQSVAPCIT